MTYDLVLRGGRVIDPAQGLDSPLDVGVSAGRIAAVARTSRPARAREIVDVRDRLVLPGLIDTHAHVYEYVTGRFGLPADLVGVHSGTTTVIDQGGPSCMTLPGFRKFVVEPAATRILAFLSAYLVGGLEGHYYPALYGPDGVDVGAAVRAARENPDLIRGIKGHAEIGGVARWGLEVLRLSAEIAREADLPSTSTSASSGRSPGPARGARIRTRSCATSWSSCAPATSWPTVHPSPRGVRRPPGPRAPGRQGGHGARLARVDVGHGSHFSFDVARRVLDAGIVPDTLGADLHGYNTRVPRPAGTPAGDHLDPELHPFAGGREHQPRRCDDGA